MMRWSQQGRRVAHRLVRSAEVAEPAEVVALDGLDAATNLRVEPRVPALVPVRVPQPSQFLYPVPAVSQTSEGGELSHCGQRLGDQRLVADLEPPRRGDGRQPLFEDSKFPDPVPGAQLPGVTALRLPVSGACPRTTRP